MRILAIETSCDETAIAVVDACIDEHFSGHFDVLGNALLSQIEVHRKYGGVFPSLAKREHAKNLVPLLTSALKEAGMLRDSEFRTRTDVCDKIPILLTREHDLADQLISFLPRYEPPKIDVIAVTAGPGLEPALWVGVNFSKALAIAWNKPLVAVNHMEGHIFAALAEQSAIQNSKYQIKKVEFPLLSLLISGGHTELVLMKELFSYRRIGETRDDAVGEAFDKTARLLGLPYPGGPEISRLAEQSRIVGFTKPNIQLPRPMINDASCDFSFAGLKTAAMYFLKKNPDLSENEKQSLAREFEDAAADVLFSKTARALAETQARTLAVGGGVSANTYIRETFAKGTANYFPEVTLRVPIPDLATDNALMIAFAGAFRANRNEFADPTVLVANGNLRLT